MSNASPHRWASFLAVECLQSMGQATGEIKIYLLKHSAFPEANPARPDEHHLKGVLSGPFCITAGQCSADCASGAVAPPAPRGFLARARREAARLRSRTPRGPRETHGRRERQPPVDEVFGEVRCILGADDDPSLDDALKEICPDFQDATLSNACTKHVLA